MEEFENIKIKLEQGDTQIDELDLKIDDIKRNFNAINQEIDIQQEILDEAEAKNLNKAKQSEFVSQGNYSVDRFTYYQNQSNISNGAYKGKKSQYQKAEINKNRHGSYKSTTTMTSTKNRT